MRTLARRELNRALLARQLLLHRARLPVPRAIERVGALQAQWPPAPYVALWTRLEGFQRHGLARAIARRQVVKATLMRTTLHQVSTRDYLAYAAVLLSRRIAELERRLVRAQVAVDIECLTEELITQASAEPRSRPDLLALLNQPRLVLDDERPWIVWHLIAARAALVHSPESSAWRRNTAGGRFAPAASWLGREPEAGPDSVDHLVHRYLAAFGPATRADISRWSGLPVAAVEPSLARLPLRRRQDERGRELLDLPRAPLPPPETPAPVRFLPWWDSALLAHADRSRILPDEYRQTVIRQNGDVQPTFLVDGFVAGTWRPEGNSVELEPFEPLAPSVERELRRETERLVAFMAG